MKSEPKKYYVTGGEVEIVHEKVMYLGADGKLVTEKFTDFTKKNILGENSTNVKGYEPQGSVDPYYAYSGDPLYEHLASIINDRATGSALETTVVDALFKTDGSCEWAYRENAIIIPQSIGGEDGVQIPFEIHYNGGRTKGTFNATTKTFTEDSSS